VVILVIAQVSVTESLIALSPGGLF